MTILVSQPMTRWIIYSIHPLHGDDVLYVGSTTQTMEMRYNQHVSNGRSRISKHIAKNGGGRQFTIRELHTVDTIQDAWEWERHLIMDLDPPYNVEHPPREFTLQQKIIISRRRRLRQ